MELPPLPEYVPPAVVEDLSDEECALYVILMDSSGLDQAEFLWYDSSVEDNRICAVCGTSSTTVHAYEHEELPLDDMWVVEPTLSPSGCFRAWAYQWVWWRCTDAMQIDQSARSVGKSLSIKVRGCAFPFVHPGQEMLITAPELVHLEPIVGLIEAQMYSTWLYREMLMTGRSGVTHRPFQMNFRNNARIIGRIPQKDGRGVKGMHPIWLEQDEAQDYPHAGWVELRETLKRGHDDARWRAHGVTKGIQDDFFEHTDENNPDNKWTVHRWVAMQRPTWTDAERQEKINEYGSIDDPDYRRNVLGKHGDATAAIFNTAQLMKCVDVDKLSDYNVEEYYHRMVKIEQLELIEQDILQVIDFPMGHLSYLGDVKDRVKAGKAPKAIYWVGMDCGFTADPSEILVWVEYKDKPGDRANRMRLLSRLSLVRMPEDEQVKAIIAVIDFYHPRAFAMDKGGNGLVLFQRIQNMVRDIRANKLSEVPPWALQYKDSLDSALTTIKGYNFSEKLIVQLEDAVLAKLDEIKDEVTKAAMKRYAKDWGTDVLRGMIDELRLEMPWDDGFLKQFTGTTYVNVKGGLDAYGRRIYSKGNDHCLDASRFMALAWNLDAIEALLAEPKNAEPVYDSFISVGAGARGTERHADSTGMGSYFGQAAYEQESVYDSFV